MAHDDTTLIGDIEDAIIQRLQGLSGVGQFDINDDPDVVRCPAVNVALYSAGIVPKTERTYRVDGKFYVTVIVTNPRSEKKRRRDAYPVVMAAMVLLGDWKPVLVEGAVTTTLGAGKLRLGPLRKVLETNARLAWAFETTSTWWFTVPQDEDTAAYIEEIGLGYLLKPWQTVPEVVDVVETGS